MSTIPPADPTSPGPFIDPQVNGYAGVDFNSDSLDAAALETACRALRRDGVVCFLPTIITDSLDKMQARLKRLSEASQQSPIAREMIPGFHVEGPFLNPSPGYIGAHPKQQAVAATEQAAMQLIEAAEGRVRILTLAPECDASATVTRRLADLGVVVSAGHSDASLDQLKQGIDAGLRMYTHLGNGCPTTLPRHDNIIQRVLSLGRQLHISFIADGHHVPLFVLDNYLQLVPPEHALLTTDAMAAAALGPGEYQLGGHTVRVAAGDAPRFDDSGQLAGSAATMPEMVDALRHRNYTPETLHSLTYANAIRLLGL